MPINEILQSDWCCDYSCSDTSAIRDCHQTLARALGLATPDYARPAFQLNIVYVASRRSFVMVMYSDIDYL